MRIRHPGMLNLYRPQARTGTVFDTTDPLYPQGMNKAAALLWFWRVKSWSWSGELTWIDETAAEFSGTFSGLIMPAVGDYGCPAIQDDTEKDLLHLQNINSIASGTGTGDATVIAINMFMGVFEHTIYEFPGNSVNDYTTRYIFPDLRIVLGLPTSSGQQEFGGLTGFNFALGFDGPDYFKQDFPEGDAVSGTIRCVPHEYWPYALDDGSQPIWDSATGAQLRDPRGDN